MIIKRPYAFLIKNFRLIHAILLILLLFVGIKTFDIYTFFNDYAVNHVYQTTGTLVSTYIDIYIFIVIVLAILFGLLIYYILSIKNKRRNTYLFLCIYYIIMFIFYIFLLSIFQELDTSSFDVKTVRAIRDVVLLVLIPQIVFIFIIFSRALGFNIKNFDFKKDLEEMQIDKSDYEEIEVTLGNNNYKIARFFRKTLRLIKYFILENKFIVIIISSVIMLIGSLTFFLNSRVYNYNYNENQEIYIHQVWYTVVDSYITNADMNGSIIDDNKSYLIVKVKFDNKTSYNQTINRNTFRLLVDDELLMPKFSISNYFLDLGDAFSSFTLNSGEVKEKNIIFEIDNEDIANEYIFKIRNLDYVKVGTLEKEYSDIIIKPNNISEVNDTGKFQIPIEMSFENSVLDNSKLLVSNYEISSTFKGNYDYCISDKCSKNTYVVKPLTYGTNTILRLESNLTLDNNTYMKKYIQSISDFYKYYATIKYRAYGVTKVIDANIITVDYDTDKYTYFEVPLEVENANKIEIILTIRGIKYTFVLK